MGRPETSGSNESSSRNSTDDRASTTLLSEEISPTLESGRDEISPSEDVTRYQDEIGQKDELIAALIRELEKAAEQLDRIQRSGGDRSTTDDSAASSSASLDTSHTRSRMMDDLRLMAEEWEQTQPPVILSRIESELAELRDLVVGLKREGVAPTAPTSFEERLRQYEQQQVAETPKEVDRGNMTLEESSPKWDEIKSQLQFSPPVQSPSTTCAEDSEILRLIANLPTPTELNCDSASIEELKAAVIERDDFIIQTNRLFRTRNTLSLPNDWAELANVPSEMQIRVESLIEHLDVQVRLGEVEMSLERARLTRERATIQSEREAMEKHMKRLGLNSIADLDSISTATGTASDRRWMRFLGPNTR